MEALNFSGLYSERSFNARNKITAINLKERTVDLSVDKLPGKEVETTVAVRWFYITYQNADCIPIHYT